MRLNPACIILICAMLAACRSTEEAPKPAVPALKEPTVLQESPEVEEKVIIRQNISDAKVLGGSSQVSACEVVATVIEIYDELDADPSNLCGQHPCFALIRIDQIVKMGQLCSPAIVPGAHLKAFFKITLSKTDNVFPDMKQHFPGLEKNDTFEASFMTTVDTEDKYHVVINAYKKAE